MKTFRLIGMAFMAVVLGIGFCACSKDGSGENGGGLITSGKKIVKIVGVQGSESETYTFTYDDSGRLIEATRVEKYDGNTYTDEYEFIWGDDMIKVKKDSYSSTLTLKNGLVQKNDENDTYTYNNSNRFIKGKNAYETITAIWDGGKMVSVSESDDDWEMTLTYGEVCKKGYSPLIPYMIGFGPEVLYMAHPEIAGMRTTNLPSSFKTDEDSINFTYEYDKEGYVTKIMFAGVTFTVTWK